MEHVHFAAVAGKDSTGQGYAELVDFSEFRLK